MSEMINQLQWPSLEMRRRVHRVTVLQQARLGHISIHVDELMHPVRRLSRHVHSQAYAVPAANKNCYKFSYIPRTIVDWNSLPDHIVNIDTIDRFKVSLLKHLLTQGV